MTRRGLFATIAGAIAAWVAPKVEAKGKIEMWGTSCVYCELPSRVLA